MVVRSVPTRPAVLDPALAPRDDRAADQCPRTDARCEPATPIALPSCPSHFRPTRSRRAPDALPTSVSDVGARRRCPTSVSPWPDVVGAPVARRRRCSRGPCATVFSTDARRRGLFGPLARPCALAPRARSRLVRSPRGSHRGVTSEGSASEGSASEGSASAGCASAGCASEVLPPRVCVHGCPSQGSASEGCAVRGSAGCSTRRVCARDGGGRRRAPRR